MKYFTLLTLIGLAGGITGCGKPVGQPNSQPAATTSVAAGPGSSVDVTVTEWSIKLTPPTVAAGNITLKIHNEGKEPHGIYVDGPSIDRKAPRLEPGAKDELTFSIPSGDFNLTDFVKDNEFTHGMKATLHAK